MTSMIRQRFEGFQNLFIINQKPCFKHGSRMIFFKRAMASMAKMKMASMASKSLPSRSR